MAYFVRTHERALANALQLRRQASKHGPSPGSGSASGPQSSASSLSQAGLFSQTSSSQSSASAALAAAFSLASFSFTAHHLKPAKLSLTPHHLFYLLSRFEELAIPVGPMNVRLESIHAESSPANYVSFLSQSQRSKGRASDRDSIHSISSVRSVVSGMSLLWSSLGIGPSNSSAKSEKAKAATQADLKYLYSAFTKIPCLRLAPDRRARLIRGYEEFPFDTAVPLWSFKNVSALEIGDIDIRQFFGWDRMADQLRSLTVRRAGVEDPADLLINIVLDDMEKRRRRSSKSQPSPVPAWTCSSPSLPHPDLARSSSAPGSPKADGGLAQSASPQSVAMARGGSEGSKTVLRPRPRSRSPSQLSVARLGSSHGHVRGGDHRLRRSGSGSSTSSLHSTVMYTAGSSSNLLATVQLPPTKWRFLKHLSLADNAITSLSATSLAPVANSLHSLDLSSNLFAQIPDCLASLTSLRALNLSDCMIDSLHSLSRNPLPAISALNLRSNRLVSIAGIERSPSLERLDLRDNKLTDPTELARLTAIPDMHEVWVGDNPFIRTHGGYRVTIFNLFREAPGYRDDILIDGTGPGYGERRQLVDRPVEPPTRPVVASSPADANPSPAIVTPERAVPATARERSSSTPQPPESPSGRSIESGTVISPYMVTSRSQRRRRGPRRRIVELSRSDINASSPFASPPTEAGHYLPSATASESGAGEASPSTMFSEPAPPELGLPLSAQPVPRTDNAVAPLGIRAQLVRPTLRSTSMGPQDWDIDSEIYRQKIEALKNEVGNGWLSVLSEGGWDGQGNAPLTSHGGEFSPASTIRPSPTTSKTASQAILSGGRTLG